MVTIAVLGCGRIGKMHAENIANHPRADLAGVFDVHEPSARAISDKLAVTRFASADDVFASPDVGAVLIATPTASHVDFIEAAVAAGKPVLCEKPIDLSLARVDACAARIAGSELPIMIGFCRRFDPGHRTARQAVLDNEIGELHQVVITSRDPAMAPDAYIESSGGIFRDMTIHDFDLARFMLGDEVTAVSAHGSRLVDPALMKRCGDFDTVVVTLTTDSGRQAVITNSRSAAYGYDQRVELFGSGGMVISENHHEHLVTRHVTGATNVSAPLQPFFIERYADAFVAEIDSFVAAVDDGKPVEVTFEDGRQALILAEAAFMSIDQGRTIRTSEIG